MPSEPPEPMEFLKEGDDEDEPEFVFPTPAVVVGEVPPPSPEENLRKVQKLLAKKAPSKGDAILEMMRRGVPLEGVFDPKTNLTAWKLGGERVHGRVVNGLIEMNRIVVEAGAFPFTNARKAKLRVR